MRGEKINKVEKNNNNKRKVSAVVAFLRLETCVYVYVNMCARLYVLSAEAEENGD
jgi:hypothetical protein